jgi:CRISPR-associated protein Csx17
VGHQLRLAALGRIDGWLDRFRRAATGQHAPASASSSLRRLESAILEACQRPDARTSQNILVALGQSEAAIAHSPKLRQGDYPMPPVPLLSPDWIGLCYAESSATACEFRLAASLASLGTPSGLRVDGKLVAELVGPFRRHLEPVDWERLRNSNGRTTWAEHGNDPSVVWTSGNLVRNMTALLERRIVDAVRNSDSPLHAPFDGRCAATLSDVCHFIEGNVDDKMIDAFARGLMLINWPKVAWKDIPWPTPARHPVPSAAYCLMKLCLLPHPVPGLGGGEVSIKLSPQIARLAAIGDLAKATKLAAQRLRSSGLPPAIEIVGCNDCQVAQRAAALVFPLRHEPTHNYSAIMMIRDRVLRRDSPGQFDNESIGRTRQSQVIDCT